MFSNSRKHAHHKPPSPTPPAGGPRLSGHRRPNCTDRGRRRTGVTDRSNQAFTPSKPSYQLAIAARVRETIVVFVKTS